jgi:long-chain acyl-CoA synthetase
MVRTHLASLVEEFRRHSNETAVVAHRGNRRYATTYGELADLAGRFAAELKQRNVAPGNRVVLWGENSAEWIAVFFGCLLRGVIVVPLDAAGSTDFAARVVNDVAPKLIVGDRHLLNALANSLASELPKISLAELAAQLPVTPEFAVDTSVNDRLPFQIVFTSGTTSEPKGIVHTHRNVLASLQPIEDEIAKYRKYERWVHPLRFLQSIPLSHVFGQFMGLWVPPLLAAEVHFVDQLLPPRMVELIHRERISVLIAVPRVIQLLRAQLQTQFPRLGDELQRARGFSALKRWWRFRRVHRALGLKFWAVISGGASLPNELELFWNRLGFALIQGYGMTETAAVVTLNHPFHVGKGTIGKALPGREVRLSEEGEILVRGEMLASATWQGGQMRPREGEWLATGDLAAKSDSGELRFLGRKGDVIVTSAGMNVHPADLEAAMRKQPGVRACVVVPCETPAGTEPVAVVLSASDEVDLQAAVANANHNLAEFQQIRRVLRWPQLELPYTSTGKLLRREVAQWACEEIAAGQQRGSANAARHDELRTMIAEVTGESAAAGGDDLRLLEDLHLDSLGRVQLLSMLEQRLGVELQDDAVAGAETLGDLRKLVGISSYAPLATEARLTISPTQPRASNDAPASALARSVSNEPSASLAAERSAAVQAASPEDVYPRWPWSWPVQAIRCAFLEIVLRPLIWLLAAPRVVRESDDSPPGPVLVIANHVTAYDGPLILYALPPKLRRRMAAAMSGEMLRDFRKARNQGNALFNLLAPLAYGLITALFNVFPLPRLRGFRRSFAHAGAALDRGYSVMIFPEGRRSHGAEVQPFRPGIGILAQESNVAVLPVFLDGLGGAGIEGAKRRWFHNGRIAVYTGRAIPVDNAMDPAELTALLEQSVRRLGPRP